MKLTGSMFFQVCVLHFCSIDGGSSSRRASWGGLGQLPGPLWAVLGRSQGLCGWSWTALRASVGGPGPSWVRSWVLCWRSWAALGVYVGGLGPHVGGLGALWERMLAVLATLGASVGGPEPSCGQKSRRT